MKPFEFRGAVYRSLHEFCKRNGVSWQKMRRLCRHYERARKDPAIAAQWMLDIKEGREVHLELEPRTRAYAEDLEKTRERQGAYRERTVQRILEG